jgi:inositol oxygenase
MILLFISFILFSLIHAETTDCTANNEQLRAYDQEKEDSRVRKHYADMRRYQTEEYVKRMEQEWANFDHGNLTIRQAFKLLESYVDASDPDMTLPNVVHNFMTAEAAREAGQPDWVQLVALLHDLGKIMFVWGKPEDGMSGKSDGPQWALGKL